MRLSTLMTPRKIRREDRNERGIAITVEREVIGPGIAMRRVKERKVKAQSKKGRC